MKTEKDFLLTFKYCHTKWINCSFRNQKWKLVKFQIIVIRHEKLFQIYFKHMFNPFASSILLSSSIILSLNQDSINTKTWSTFFYWYVATSNYLINYSKMKILCLTWSYIQYVHIKITFKKFYLGLVKDQ